MGELACLGTEDSKGALRLHSAELLEGLLHFDLSSDSLDICPIFQGQNSMNLDCLSR